MDTKYPSCHHSIQDHPYYDVVHYESYMSYMSYSHNVIHIYIHIYIYYTSNRRSSTVLQHRASETGPRGATLGRGNGQALEGAALMLRKMTYKNTRPQGKKGNIL